MLRTLPARRPNYRSILRFRQLEQLTVESSCGHDCTSTIADDIVIRLARAMPKLEYVWFGNSPCKTPTGVTAKGFRPSLIIFRVFLVFQVPGLDTSEIPQVTSGGGPTIPREDCALACLRAGDTHVPEETTLMLPKPYFASSPDSTTSYIPIRGGRRLRVQSAFPKKLADCSGKKHPHDTPRRNADDTPFHERHLRAPFSCEMRGSVSLLSF